MRRTKSFMASVVAFVAAGAGSLALAAPPPPPTHSNNGTFLTHAYVSTASFISANFNTMASNMQFDYGVNRLFVICGGINSSGAFSGGASSVPQVATFLNAVHSWESAHPGYTFEVYAYLSGSLTPGSSFIDVSSSAVRANIATESSRFTSATVSGSYVSGASRTFDGVFIDFEPAGGTTATQTAQFNNLKTVMDGVRSALGSGKKTAFAAPQYNGSSSSTWVWTPTYYYYMAGHVDLIVAMEYDTGLTSGSSYQSWIDAQTVSILQAVSGEYWTDGSHQAPANGVKVLFAFPAYPSNLPNHNASVENITNAANGVNAGLSSVDSRALATFGAAIVYLATDGSGSDGYAGYSTDWVNFVSHW